MCEQGWRTTGEAFSGLLVFKGGQLLLIIIIIINYLCELSFKFFFGYNATLFVSIISDCWTCTLGSFKVKLCGTINGLGFTGCGVRYGQSIKYWLIDWFSFLDLPKCESRFKLCMQCFCPKSGIPIILYIFTGHFKPFLLNPSLHCNNRMLRSELYAPFVHGSVKCLSFGHIKVLAEELLNFLL